MKKSRSTGMVISAIFLVLVGAGCEPTGEKLALRCFEAGGTPVIGTGWNRGNFVSCSMPQANDPLSNGKQAEMCYQHNGNPVMENGKYVNCRTPSFKTLFE